MLRRNKNLDLIQVLRGLAACLVILKHTLYEIGEISAFSYNARLYDPLVVGVDIFFVISGFIMVYTTAGQSGVQAARRFMLRRIVRIVPLYWFYTVALLCVALIVPQVLGKAQLIPIEFIKSLLFIPYLNSAGDVQPFLSLGWTLNYEMYFYVIFALCLCLPARFLLPLLTGYFGLTVSLGVFESDSILLQFYTNPIVLEFLCGAILGYAYLKGVRLPKAMTLIGSLAAIVLFLFTLNDASYFTSLRGVIAVVFVAAVILLRGSEGLAAPRFGKVIGDASYTLYLSHPFAIGAVTQLIVFLGLGDTLPFWLICISILFTSVSGGLIAYFLIEKPLLSWTKKVTYKT